MEIKLGLIDTEAKESGGLSLMDGGGEARAPLSEESVEMEHGGGQWTSEEHCREVTGMVPEKEASMEV